MQDGSGRGRHVTLVRSAENRADVLTRVPKDWVTAENRTEDMAAAVGTPVIFYGDARHPMQLGTDHFPWYPSARFVSREAQQPIAEIARLITDDVQAFTKKWHAGEIS